jgi:glycolate oxidase
MSTFAPRDCRSQEAALADLRAVVGNEHLLTEIEDTLPYGFDGTAALRQRPLAVVFPGTTEEVSACVKVCARHNLPVHARGSGTGLSGGSVPRADGIVLCLTRLSRILNVDPANLTLRAEAGVITQRINEVAATHDLFYPPDPGSQKISTIGGNVAENSGGLRGLKYGVTRNYVMGLTVVLPDGEIVTLGNACVKDVAGYSMKDLFIGSEGTLGIVTEVLLRLLPRPESRRTLLAVFDDMTAAAQTVSAIIAAKIIPCTLEFLDRTTIRCVEDYAQVGLPTDCAALLLMETDGARETVEREAAKMETIATKHGARSVVAARDEQEAARLATARRTAFSALARLRPTTILEDVTVPRSELPRLVAFIAGVAERHGLLVGTFGHMGDGNLHPTFLTDERDAGELQRVHQALDEIVGETLRLGGTITGEHGVGLAKKPWLRQQLGDASFALMKRFKQTLDPHNRLNPGKIFD